jgi:hypothetical protein
LATKIIAPKSPSTLQPELAMTDWRKEAETQYAALAGYAEIRQMELSHLLQPYTAATDRYGVLFCEVILILGKSPPKTPIDRALRDLIADVFDFLYEARTLILKGKLDIAYPLARRAYESLSLMVACHLDPKLAERWIAGKQIDNERVRRLLAKHPFGEGEEQTREFYKFFSRFSHPNRDMMAQRFLGEGNEFALGSIGRPSLVMLADYALKTLNLWFWFGAFVHFVYLGVLRGANPTFGKDYDEAAKVAQQVAPWLSEQFNRTLAQEQAEMQGEAPPTDHRQNDRRTDAAE